MYHREDVHQKMNREDRRNEGCLVIVLALILLYYGHWGWAIIALLLFW